MHEEGGKFPNRRESANQCPHGRSPVGNAHRTNLNRPAGDQPDDVGQRYRQEKYNGKNYNQVLQLAIPVVMKSA